MGQSESITSRKVRSTSLWQCACAAGGLCVGRLAPGADARRAADFASFRAFNRSLHWRCAAEPPAELLVAPNSTWPDIVYYHSFTHAGESDPRRPTPALLLNLF